MDNGSALGAPAPTEPLTLDQLCALIHSRFGSDVIITQREHGDGSSEALLTTPDGALRAAWRGRLMSTPPRDGVTPRGPKEYYGIQFFSAS